MQHKIKDPKSEGREDRKKNDVCGREKELLR